MTHGAGDFPNAGNNSNDFSGSDYPNSGLRARLHHLTTAPPVGGDVFDDITQYLKAAAEAAAAGGIVGAEAESAGIVATVAAGLASVCSLPVIVVAILVLLCLIFLEAVLVNVGNSIPLVSHTGLVPWLRHHFAWLTTMENAIGAFVHQTIMSTIHEFGGLIVILLELQGFDLKPINKTVRVTTTDPRLNATLRNLQREINELKTEVHSSGTTTHTTTYVNRVPSALWSELHTAQHEISNINKQILDLYGRVEHATNIANSVASQEIALSRSLRQVRALSVGLQELEGDMTELGNRVTTIQNNTSERLHEHQRQLTRLEPLLILEEPGLKGLKTLRQLEDTPCMCPRIANIPNELGTALAVLEFIENG